MENVIAKKSLGQNWLKSKVALNKMLEAGDVTADDIVLEVGPGQGILTEKLLEKAKKVIAVEKDDRLISFLQEKFTNEIDSGNLILIHSDILNFDTQYWIPDTQYKLIANIPYYITGQFLRKFLATPSSLNSVARSTKSGFRETKNQPSKIVIMVQKEIAQRIVANDKKESILSISVKAYGQPKMIMKVGKENFSPAPKVDSAILLINNISKDFFTQNKISEEKFFAILHAGFAHKRKILSSNLKGFVSPEKLASLTPKIRAEDLNLEGWGRLGNK